MTSSLNDKILHQTIIGRYNKYKKKYQKDQQLIQSSDNLYRKSLQENIIEENDYASLCTTFTRFLHETKIDLFFEIEEKNKNKIF